MQRGKSPVLTVTTRKLGVSMSVAMKSRLKNLKYRSSQLSELYTAVCIIL